MKHTTTHRRMSRTGPVAVAIAAALLAAACSGSSSPSSAGGKGTAGSHTTTTSAPAPFNQAQFVGQPEIGGSIKFGVESTIATLDPASNLAQPSDIDIALAIYDPLVAYDAKGNFAPGLATSWSNSKDLMTWTIKVRTGIQFTDGTPFNVDAVVKQFERFKDPATDCTCAPDVALISSITAPDPTTVVFKLTQPNALFLSTLAGILGLIASPTATAKYGKDYTRHPVGTGAFSLTSFDTLVLKRNPRYWRKDAQGRQLPYLDQITIVPIPDTTVRLQSVEAGDVDAIQTDDVATIIQAIKQKNLVVQKVDGSSATITIFNMRKPPFNDIRMRQAVAYALNRDELNNVLYEGAEEPAYSPFATNSPFFADVPHPTYNPAKAKALVEEVKKSGGLTKANTTCIATPEGRSGLAITQRQSEAVGLSGSNVFLDQGAYVNKVIGPSHDFTVGCFRDPQIANADGLYNSLHTGGSGNVMGYSNKTVDHDLEAIRRTTDQATQIRLLKAIQVILAHDVPVIPLLYDLYANIHSDKISGFPVPEADSLGAIKFATLYRVVGR